MQSPLLRRLIANLLNKEVRIRKNFRQSSVVGGAFICSRQLKGEEAVGTRSDRGMEVAEPDDGWDPEGLYQEWKEARMTFKRIVQL